MDEQTYKMLARLKETSDGKDFIELLQRMSENNYKAFKQSPSEYNDIHKGQAIAIDGILELFDKCEQKLVTNNKQDGREWL